MLKQEELDGVVVVRMDHGPVNAMDTELCDGVADALDALHEAPAVVITGNGRAFSAGVDLRRIVEEGPAYTRGFLPALSRLFTTAFSYPRPLIAAIDGHAIAGGTILALACDLRVLAEGRPRMGLSELAVGVPFPTAAIEVARHVLGPRLDRVVLEADLLDPEAALRLGMVDEILPAEQVEDRALELARHLAAVPPDTFAHTRRQLRAAAWERVAGPPDGAEEFAEHGWTSEDGVAAMEGFIARTLNR